MKTLVSSFAAIALSFASLGAEPANGVALDIAATPENPRNSEGAFATLKSGRVIFCYSQFYGGDGDSSAARIAEIYSDDQGRTWSRPRIVVENGRNRNVMSVSLLRLASGRLALFYAVKKSPMDCHPVMQVSGDDGATWSEPRQVFDAPGYFVINNDRVIQAARGRLILPVAYHRVLSPKVQDYGSVDLRGIVIWYLSDDEGATWRESPTWWALPVASPNGLQEPGVVELADGSLFSWARTDQGCQYGFRSRDGGETWSAPEPTELKSPISPASIKRLPGSDDLLAIYNDHSGRFPFSKRKNIWSGRDPLVAAVSHDGGRTWPLREQVEDDLRCDYCYTAVHFDGDAVLFAYGVLDSDDHRPGLLRIRRMTLPWLLSQLH